MIVVALVALLGYAVLTGVTGMRLLLLAKQTGKLPEASLGVSYLVGGMLGWALLLMGGTIAARPGATQLGLGIESVGLFCLSTGTLAVALFSWRVFSPDNRVLRALFFVLTAVLAADFVRNAILTRALIPPTSNFWYWPGALGRTLCFFWMAAAGMRYAGMLEKRLQLGLTDAVVANRVRLWGYAGLTGAIVAVVACGASVLDLWATHGPALFLFTSAFGFLGSVLGWLAFVPPLKYLRWVEARAAKAAA